jgi:hypothetical protein
VGNGKPHQLYIPTDSHINACGASIIASTLKQYLDNNFKDLILQLPSASSVPQKGRSLK